MDGIRVLDLTDERGFVGGWMLAELGADVVAIEPPDGSPARRIGPFADDDEAPNRSLPWWAYARNKRSAVVELLSEAGRRSLRELAQRADIFIESQRPGMLSALAVRIRRSLSPRSFSTRIEARVWGRSNGTSP